jgi:hypothetical protein
MSDMSSADSIVTPITNFEKKFVLYHRCGFPKKKGSRSHFELCLPSSELAELGQKKSVSFISFESHTDYQYYCHNVRVFGGAPSVEAFGHQPGSSTAVSRSVVNAPELLAVMRSIGFCASFFAGRAGFGK